MSHEIEQHDQIVLAGKPAWHGLGLVVENAPNPLEAVKLANLDWEVELAPLYGMAEDEEGKPIRIVYENKFGLYRNDVYHMLGDCSEHYVPIQNIDVANLIFDVAADNNVEVETAGSLQNGKKVFFLVRTGSLGLQNGDDVIDQFALFHMGHTGRMALTVEGTGIRVLCANTLRAAQFGNSRISIRHMGEAAYDLTAIRAQLGDIKAKAEMFAQQMEKSIETEWNKERMAEYFVSIWSNMNGDIPDEEDSIRHNRMIDTIDAWHRYADEHEYQEQCRGTAYAAYQAVTQYASHDMIVRDMGHGAADTRANSILFGRGNDLTREASKVLADVLA